MLGAPRGGGALEHPQKETLFSERKNRRNVQSFRGRITNPGPRLGRDSMYENILYPTDGSDGARAAMDTVQNLAEAYGATVHVLNVVDTTYEGIGGDPHTEQTPGMVGDPEGGTGGMVGDRTTMDEAREQVQKRGEQVVEETADRMTGVDTVAAISAGTPHEVILDYVDEHDIDMVVMGTHGRTGVDRYLIGSVTEKVVRLAEVPVVSVRSEE